MPAMSREYNEEVEEWITDLHQNTDLQFVWAHTVFLIYEVTLEEAALQWPLN